MRKIGGIKMNTAIRLKGTIKENRVIDRYCSVYESIKESLKEVKLHKEGKIHLDTWEEYVIKKHNNKIYAYK